MSQKSKASSLVSAVRFAPIAASLTALALVAACARTNPGKSKISPETDLNILQSQFQKNLSAVGKTEFKPYDPANMDLAAHFLGATLDETDSSLRLKGQIQARVSIAMKDSPDLIASGTIKAGSPSDLTDANAISIAPSFKISGQCADDDCENVVVTVAQVKAVLPSMLPETKVADVVKTPDASTQAQAQDQKAVATTTPEAVPTGAELVLMFKLTQAAKPEVIATQNNPDIPATPDKYELERSSPTTDQKSPEENLKSGSVLSFEAAKGAVPAAVAPAPATTAKTPDVKTTGAATSTKDAAAKDLIPAPATNGTATPEQAKAAALKAAAAAAKLGATAPAQPAPVQPPAKVVKFTPVKNPAAVPAALAAAKPLAATAAPTPKTVQLVDVSAAAAPKTQKVTAKASARQPVKSPAKSPEKSPAKSPAKSGSKTKAPTKKAVRGSKAAQQLPSITAINPKK